MRRIPAREWLLLSGLLALGLVLPPLVALVIEVLTIDPEDISRSGGIGLIGFLRYFSFYEVLFRGAVTPPLLPEPMSAWSFPVGSGRYTEIGRTGAWLMVVAPYALIQLVRSLRIRFARQT